MKLHILVLASSVTLLAAIASAQPQPTGAFDPKALAEVNKKIFESTKGMKKESVEEAQDRLDVAIKEFVALLNDNGIAWPKSARLDAGIGQRVAWLKYSIGYTWADKRVHSVVNNIAKKQAQIDKIRGGPRKYVQLKPFAGTWEAKSETRHMEFTLDEHGNGHYSVTMVSQGKPFAVSASAAFFDPAESLQGNTLNSGDDKFTLSEDGAILTADVHPEFDERTFDYKISLQRVAVEPPPKKPGKKQSP